METSALIGPPVVADFAARAASESGLDVRLGRIEADSGAVDPRHLVVCDIPDHRGAALQIVDDFLGGLGHGHAGGEGRAAAAGQHGEADRGGVGDDRAHLFDRQAQHLGRHHGHGGARAADIRVAGDHHGAAVLAHVDRGGGFAADVEPEARRRRRVPGWGRAAPDSADDRGWLRGSRHSRCCDRSGHRRPSCRPAPRSSRAGRWGPCRA